MVCRRELWSRTQVDKMNSMEEILVEYNVQCVNRVASTANLMITGRLCAACDAGREHGVEVAIGTDTEKVILTLP